jgi:hypothetical protein
MLGISFAKRENRDDNVLQLWDDFSEHWTPSVVACAASLNIILLKVPPKNSYVCQPADISWNKPFKGEIRSLWIDRLKEHVLKCVTLSVSPRKVLKSIDSCEV